MVLWLRIHLPAQGTWDGPCSGKILHATDTEPMHQSRPSTQEKPPQWENGRQQRRPRAVKNK